MQERERLMMQKHELEQLIFNHQWSAPLSAYAAHPADMASNLQILNIELERINEALAQCNTEQLS